MSLVNKLPKSYKELSYKKYVRIMLTIPSEEPEVDPGEWSAIIHLATLGVLLDMEVSELEKLPVIEIIQMTKAISFMDVEPKKDKCRFAVKSMDELTYDEFAKYQKLRVDQWENLGDILLLVCKDMAPEQLEELSIYDAMQVFFCLKKQTTKFLNRLRYSTLKTLLLQSLRMIFRYLTRLGRNKSKSLPAVGAGLN